MELTISSANYKILKTGSVITFDKDSDISFEIEFKEINFRFELEFKFVSTETKKIGIEKKIESNDKIIIECKNFENQLGIGTTEPVDLATIENKKMYMNFSVGRLTNAQRTLNYTFYIEK